MALRGYRGAATALAGLSLLLAACGGSTGSSPSQSSSAALPPYAAKLDQEIPQLMKDNAIPGAIVKIESRDAGDWSATFGTRELGKDEPMRLDDHFRIGSNTKTMTTTVILELVQKGELALDDPIAKYVPGVPNGKKITIAQLAEMRSGLFSYTSSKKFNETLDKDPQKAWTPQELLDIAFSHPVTAAPGKEFDYCNTNYVLLGLVIEKLTGKSADVALADGIFQPLGLEQTLLPAADDAAIPQEHPRGYQFGTNVQTLDSYALPPKDVPAALNGTLLPHDDTDANPSWAWTAGGAISDADDLTAYVKALVNGGLLDEQMQTIRKESLKPIQEGNPASPRYGLGWVEFAPNVLGHDGQLPGFASFMVHDPVKDNTIVIAVNLSASPVTGENAAVVLGKAAIQAMYGIGVGGDPAGGKSASPTATSAQ